MNYTYDCRENKVIVSIKGTLNENDLGTMNEIHTMLEHALPPLSVVFDLSEVQSVDEQGLKGLIGLVHEIPVRGQELFLSNSSWFEDVLQSNGSYMKLVAIQ